MSDRLDNFELPPPPAAGQGHSASDESKLLTYVEGLMQEAYDGRTEYDDRADRNNELHIGRSRLASPAHGVTPVDVNRVRNVDIAHVQVQTESTPRIKLSARESGDHGTAFIDVRANLGAMEQQLVLLTIDPVYWKPDATGSVQALPDAVRDRLQAAITAGTLPLEVMIVVNDRAMAEGKQTVFDAMWEDCTADFYLREAALKKTIIGWQFILYGFNDQTRKHELSNPSHLQVFCDPLCTDIRDAAHAEVLQWIDLYRAIAAYPKHADAFREAVIPAGSYAENDDAAGMFRVPQVYQRTQFRRPMVAVRHCWIRDYPFPMTAQEALAAGLVQQTTPAIPMDSGEGATATDGAPAVHDGGEDNETDDAVAGGYVLVDGGRPVKEGDVFGSGGGWPSVPRIRQICFIGRTCVQDGPTEFGDIPLPHIVDQPIIDSPYGQGQPEALEPLQLALNALLTDLVTHFHYFGTPPVAMPVSVAQRLPGFKAGVYSAPHSEIWEIPDDLIQKFGGIKNIVQFIEVPAIPADFWRFFDMLLSLIDKEGQVTEALEGQGKQGWSGELVARLQQAARGLIGWKSQRMEHAIEYLARLMLHTIDTRLSAQELSRLCSKYPPYVWEYIRSQPSNLDVKVEIVSGSGQMREKAKEEAIALNRNGQGPLSDTTLLERFEEDPDHELQNKVAEAEKRAKAASTIQAAAPAVGAAAPTAPPPPQPAGGGAPFPPGQPVAAAA